MNQWADRLTETNLQEKMAKFSLLSITITCLLFIAPPAMCADVWKTTTDLPNYFNFAPGLYRGGQPSPEGLATLKENGVKTVISFRHNKALTEAESAEAKKLDLNFYSLPISGVNPPPTRLIKKFLNIVNDPQAKPVFIHCEEGVDRTGLMVAIYRIEDLNWSASEAYKEMLAHGFHTRYPWMADAVFDWAQSKHMSSAGRPLSVKVYDVFEFVTGVTRLPAILVEPSSVKSDKE